LNRPADTVVIGLGNVILSDDGLGVHAVRRLRERYALDADIELVEGGTAGLLLLPYLQDARRAILVDAIDTGSPPGTLTRLNGEDWTNCSTLMTPHDVALEDLLAATRLTGTWPEELALLGAQPARLTLGTSLSPPVEAALAPLVDAIMAQLSAWTVVMGEPCA
jgi:hydrogenase maturation protease